MKQTIKQGRMMRTKRMNVLITLLIGYSAAAWGGFGGPMEHRLPEVTLMPNMQHRWVAKHMVVNGVPMSVRAFVSDRTPEQVLEYYTHRWKAKGLAQVARSQHGEEKTIGMEYRGHYYTVQVHDRPSGSQGTLTVTQSLLETAPSTNTDFPLVPGSQVLSKIESKDFGQRAETLTYTNNQSASSNAIFVTAALERNGWVQQEFSKDPAMAGRVLNFQKANQLCQISIVDHQPGQTLTLVNWIKGK